MNRFALEIVLWVKVAFTILAWALPLLLTPASWFERLGIPTPQPLLFVRLLGAAFVALLVNYLFGIRDLHQHKDITEVVWVGIVSNGLACLVMLAFGSRGAWKDWSKVAQAIMWISVVLTGAITAGLIITGLIAGGAAAKP